MNDEQARALGESLAQKTIKALDEQRAQHEAYQAELHYQIFELQGKNMAFSLAVDNLVGKAPQPEQIRVRALLDIALENWPSNAEDAAKAGFRKAKKQIEDAMSGT